MYCFVFSIFALFPSLTAFLYISISSDITSSKANETYKLAWMLLIAIVPVGGALFYLLFANKRDNKRQRKKIINYNNLLIKYGNYTNDLYSLEKKDSDGFALCRALYEKGYIPDDVLSPSWSSWNTMLTGNFIWVDGCQMWGTKEVWNERIPGSNLDSIYLNPDGPSFRPQSFRNDTAVSSTSTHPAEAVKFMEWMYSSQENYDLVVYGVEGLTWENTGDGTYKKLIPDFEFNADWMIGNMKYERYEDGTYEKFIEIMGVEKPDAENSIVLNFVFDPTNVATEYANCLAEVEASVYPIKLGIVSYEDGFEDALANLKAAGIDAVIAEYQSQLDAYLAENN